MTVQAKDRVVQVDGSSFSTDSQEASQSTVVGVLAPSIYWRNLITDILPDGSGAVDAVFRLGSSVFTYRIDGPNAIFLGQGDRHDTHFDQLATSGRLFNSDSQRSTSYTGLPVSEYVSDYTIHIYPSADMEDQFLTSNPACMTALTVLIFAFTVRDCRLCK